MTGLCSCNMGEPRFLAGSRMWDGSSVSGWLAGRDKYGPRLLRIDDAELPGRVTTVQYSSLYGSEITTPNTPPPCNR